MLIIGILNLILFYLAHGIDNVNCVISHRQFYV